MTPNTRIRFGIAAGVAGVAAVAILLGWVFASSRPDPVAALRERLVGESARGVESLLGQPSFRDHDDRTWHYLSDVQVRQFAADAPDGAEIVVELDAKGTVERVYIER